MRTEDLLYDSSRATIDNATVYVLNDIKLFKNMIDLSLKGKTPYSQRASRVVFFCAQENPALIEPYLGNIISAAETINNDSLKSNLLKIFAEVTLPEDEDLIGELADLAFRFMNMSSEVEGLKIYSMEVLFKISDIYPEINNELRLNIEKLIPHNKMGFRSRGNRILKKLYKELDVNKKN